MNIETRRIIGRLIKLLSPGYSWCAHCEMPWSIAEGHVVNYSHNSGIFPCCTYCWPRLDRAERLRYARELWESWGETDAKWDDIENAVLRESLVVDCFRRSAKREGS